MVKSLEPTNLESTNGLDSSSGLNIQDEVILVTGANGVVGTPLVNKLEASGVDYIAVSRSSSEGKIPWNLEEAISPQGSQAIERCTSLIHCAPIWLLPDHLPALRSIGINRLVIFSSTSVISKKASQSQQEQELVQLLANAEAKISAYCRKHEMHFTIIRPSMIYGYGRDQNVSHIAGFIKKYRVMVLVGRAQGLRQPVHADDLVDAALRLLSLHDNLQETYNLAGKEALTYRQMVERIFKGMNRPVRILSLPLWLFRIGLWSASKLTSFNYTAQMADRMSHDLTYSNDRAMKDFSYSPQPFLSNAKRDLP